MKTGSSKKLIISGFIANVEGVEHPYRSYITIEKD
jgi:hypothetical protein